MMYTAAFLGYPFTTSTILLEITSGSGNRINTLNTQCLLTNVYSYGKCPFFCLLN